MIVLQYYAKISFNRLYKKLTYLFFSQIFLQHFLSTDLKTLKHFWYIFTSLKLFKIHYYFVLYTFLTFCNFYVLFVFCFLFQIKVLVYMLHTLKVSYIKSRTKGVHEFINNRFCNTNIFMVI